MKDENKDAKGQPEASRVSLPKEAQGRIGQHLRRVYSDILSEPLPDKFAQLLDELAKSERKNDGK